MPLSVGHPRRAAPSFPAPGRPLLKAVGPCRRQRPGLRDPLELRLAAQVGLPLGKDAEHAEETFAGGRVGIDRLLGRLEGGAASSDRPRDVLQVTDARARRSIRVTISPSPLSRARCAVPCGPRSWCRPASRPGSPRTQPAVARSKCPAQFFALQSFATALQYGMR
jgi:hypothetical protein